MTPAGFPHSEISGSKLLCSSPELIAAFHVLRRLSAPRHPPCTLHNLTKLECIFVNSTNLLSMPEFSCQRSLDRRRSEPKGGHSSKALKRCKHHPGQRPLSKAEKDSAVKSKICKEQTRNRALVELIGVEPTTSAVQGRRSPN